MAGGRPLGTFSDPALRMRAWHWLGATMDLAGVKKPRDLDRSVNALSKGLEFKPRFDQIRQDGYDPDRVIAFGKTSLLDHVASKRRFRTTRAVYRHMLWKHLQVWEPLWPGRAAWLAGQLDRYRIVRYIPNDEVNAVELGLLPEPDARSPREAPPLTLNPTHFATLDGVLLLLALCREAEDAGHVERANRLRSTLQDAAETFAHNFGYSGEVLDTWRFLTASRMLSWHPHVEPIAGALECAEEQLLEEGARSPDRRAHPSQPRKNGRSRSDRRWRRRVWVRACCLYLDRSRIVPNFEYRDASPLFDWLIGQREAIGLHRVWAMQWLILGKDRVGPNGHPPLEMPETLYTSRRRPPQTEQGQGVFGDVLPFDVIPVMMLD